MEKTRTIKLDVLLALLIEAKAKIYAERETTPEELTALSEIVNAYCNLSNLSQYC